MDELRKEISRLQGVINIAYELVSRSQYITAEHLLQREKTSEQGLYAVPREEILTPVSDPEERDG